MPTLPPAAVSGPRPTQASTTTPTPTVPVAMTPSQPHPSPTNRFEPRPAAPASPAANGAADRNGSSPTHVMATPPTATNPVPAGSPAVLEALRATQANLVALQRLGEQTADLHRQFLEGQDLARRTFQTLLEQQQRLALSAASGEAPVAFTVEPLSVPHTAETNGETPVAPVVIETPAPAPAFEPPAPVVAAAPAPPAAPVVEFKPDPPAPVRAPIVAPVVQAPAPVVEAPAPARKSGASRVLPVLIEVVSEKTGYPTEMLEPAMQLDADLGIDSIKRVEILSAIQERLPEAPAVKPEHLGTLRTLQDIADFLGAGQAETAAPAAAVPAVVLAPAGPSVMGVLLEVVSEKTGYPTEMLEPAMQLDADLGIDSIKRVEILSAIQERLPEAPAVKPEHLGTLRTLQDIADFLDSASTPAPAAVAPVAAPATVQEEPVAEGSVQRLVVRRADAPAPGAGHGRAMRDGGEVWVLDDGHGLAPSIARRLTERGYRVKTVDRARCGRSPLPKGSTA
ncbi:MAG: phosphopantetheine-binding protein [Isosphaeraceae bacterium]